MVDKRLVAGAIAIVCTGCVAPQSSLTGQGGSATGGGGSNGASTHQGTSVSGPGSASGSGSGGSTTGVHGNKYHPDDFGLPLVHGIAANLQKEDCRKCHGAQLDGGSSNVSCDSCHLKTWRTDCTYCHGGDDNDLGSPPRDIDGQSAVDTLSFRAHTKHVTVNDHAAFACTECHVTPVAALDPGHAFDDTPGKSEVDFSAGLSPETMWSTGTCTSVYCHGNGRVPNGTAQDTMPKPGCGGCHGHAPGDPVPVSDMSGQHQRHITAGLDCVECHVGVVAASSFVVGPDLHVDGQVTVALAQSGMSWSNGSCTGLCHLKAHFSDSW